MIHVRTHIVNMGVYYYYCDECGAAKTLPDVQSLGYQTISEWLIHTKLLEEMSLEEAHKFLHDIDIAPFGWIDDDFPIT